MKHLSVALLAITLASFASTLLPKKEVVYIRVYKSLEQEYLATMDTLRFCSQYIGSNLSKDEALRYEGGALSIVARMKDGSVRDSVTSKNK
jgi:hypothetical protein